MSVGNNDVYITILLLLPPVLQLSLGNIWQKDRCSNFMEIDYSRVIIQYPIALTVPTVATWVSKPLYCPIVHTGQWEAIVIYHSITLLVLIQLCIPRCCHLDLNYCSKKCRQSQLRFVLSSLLLHLRLLGTFLSDIPFFALTWSTKLSPNQEWKSTHRLHLNNMIY